MVKSTASREAKLDPQIVEKMQNKFDKVGQGFSIFYLVIAIVLAISGTISGFWQIIFHSNPLDWLGSLQHEFLMSLLGLMSPTPFFAILGYGPAIDLKKMRRSIALVQECTPYPALLTIRTTVSGPHIKNDDASTWLLRVGEKNDTSSIIVKTLDPLEVKNAKKINNSIALIYRTANPEDPIVIQTIHDVLICTPDKDIIEEEDEDLEEETFK